MVIYYVEGLSTDREDCRAHPTQNIITNMLTLKHTKKQVDAVWCCRNYFVCRWNTERSPHHTAHSTLHTAHSTLHNVAMCCAVLRCLRAVICGGLQSSYIPPQYTLQSTQHTAHTTQHTAHNSAHHTAHITRHTTHSTEHRAQSTVHTAHRHRHTHA